MEVNQLRNTVREWFRAQVDIVEPLAALPLVVTNEASDHGVEVVWMRQTLQTGETVLAGIGTASRRSIRVCRCFIEIFGPKGEGEGVVGELATLVEGIWREAISAANSPHPHIYVSEPSTFERPEGERYCQVVSVPIRVDHFS